MEFEVYDEEQRSEVPLRSRAVKMAVLQPAVFRSRGEIAPNQGFRWIAGLPMVARPLKKWGKRIRTRFCKRDWFSWLSLGLWSPLPTMAR